MKIRDFRHHAPLPPPEEYPGGVAAEAFLRTMILETKRDQPGVALQRLMLMPGWAERIRNMTSDEARNAELMFPIGPLDELAERRALDPKTADVLMRLYNPPTNWILSKNKLK